MSSGARHPHHGEADFHNRADSCWYPSLDSARECARTRATANPEGRLSEIEAASPPLAGRYSAGIPGALVLVAILLAGCAPSGEKADFLARRAVLERQNQGIRELIAEAEQGSLVPADRLLVGVDEKVIVEILRARLPFDLPLGKQFVVRLSDATVLLRDNIGRFQLQGEIHRPGTPGRRTAVEVTGSLGAVRIEPGTGLLTMSVVLDHLEVKEGGLLEKVLGRGGQKFVTGNARGLLQEALPPLQIPVAFTQDLHLPGYHDGSIQLDSLVVRLGLSVERVLAVDGKLWVTLHGGIRQASGAGPGPGIHGKLTPKPSGTSSIPSGRAPARTAPERARGVPPGGGS